jgi:hypothetical protein
MKAIAFLIVLCLSADMAWAGGTGRPGRKPAQPKPKVIDLDFTEEDRESEAVAAAPSVSAPEVGNGWVYWTLGGALVAAAGGVGWYLHHEQDPETSVTRKDQIFTDERP